MVLGNAAHLRPEDVQAPRPNVPCVSVPKGIGAEGQELLPPLPDAADEAWYARVMVLLLTRAGPINMMSRFSNTLWKARLP